MRLVAEIAPGQPGTRTLTKHYGAALIKVRIYKDELRLKRIQTVELLLEETDCMEPTKKIQARPPSCEDAPPLFMSAEAFKAAHDQRCVFLRIDDPDPVVLTGLRVAGAQYHEPSQSWVLSREQAEQLGLLLPQVFAWTIETLPDPLPVGIPAPPTRE